LVEIGASSPNGGAASNFDNEAPVIALWLEPYAMANRLVRNRRLSHLHRR